jgi:hypothetical protein
MFMIYLHTKFPTSDSVFTITKPKAEIQINKIIKHTQVKTIWEVIRQTGVPQYLWVIRSKTYRGYMKPQIIPSAIHNVIYV